MLDRWLQTVKSIKFDFLQKIELYGVIDLVYRTGGQSRYYHTMEHIAHCFKELDEASFAWSSYKPDPQFHGEKLRTEIEIALWCHDAFYDPQRKDNEERSAQLAFAICSEFNFFAPRVSEFVLLTKHNTEPEDQVGKIITDVDLSVLGQTYGPYHRYQEGIYKEYNAESDWIIFADKRIEVLELLLKRNNGRIYYTDHFYNKCAKNAFTNMSREIIELRQKKKTEETKRLTGGTTC